MRSEPTRSIVPEPRKPIRRKCCVPCGALQVSMAEVVRQRARIVAIVGEFVPGRMPQHVRVNREGKLCGLACSLNHPQKPSCGHWRARFCGEHIRAVALQWAQRSKLRPMQGMDAF